MSLSETKAEEALNLLNNYGKEEAAKIMGVKTETLRRYCRIARKTKDESEAPPEENLIRQIRDRYSDAELRAIAKGSFHERESADSLKIQTGDRVKIGVITDTHIGSKYSEPARLQAVLDFFAEQGTDIICHCGDVTEGLSSRPGHVYELTDIGYHAQLDAAREAFEDTHCPVYMIDGNHDRWYLKSAGACIVQELCRDNKKLIYMGHDEGDLDIKGVKLRLWHGEDASSYAFSYRLQKIIESFTGGEKPQVLFAGHTHKSYYCFDRNVHCLSAGSMQKQSKWMRGKRIACHYGFWIVDIEISKKQVVNFTPTYYPFYE